MSNRASMFDEEITNVRNGSKFGCLTIALVTALILGIIGAFVGFPHSVDASEGCVITRGGKITGTADPGYVFLNFTESKSCMTLRTQVFEAVLGEAKSSDAKWSAPPCPTV